MAVVLPPGVKVEFTLPPYSNLPGQTPEQLDTNALICAAFSTAHFPVAKAQGLALVNKFVSNYHYTRPTNRAQRRKAKV